MAIVTSSPARSRLHMTNTADLTDLHFYMAPRADGLNHNVRCPDCGQRECSARVANGTLMWRCFRASCGSQGRVDRYSSAAFTQPAPAQPKDEPYTGDVFALTTPLHDTIAKRFYLDDQLIHRYIKTNKRRYVLPVLNPREARRGYCLRQPWVGTEFEGMDTQGPKTLTFMDKATDVPLAWYMYDGGINYNYRGRPVVLVEDQISAIRVMQDSSAVGCALLGVALTDAKVAEIQRVTARVVLALDQDASATAFKLARKWQHAFESFRVCILMDEDIKTMTPGAVCDLLEDFV